jgi:hypothetical protein
MILTTFNNQFGKLDHRAASDDPFNARDNGSFNKKFNPYSIYSWEIGLHAPITLFDALLKAQQFDNTLEVCHKVFDLSAVGAGTNPTEDNKRFWKFGPFRDLANKNAEVTIEQIFLRLWPQISNDNINE